MSKIIDYACQIITKTAFLHNSYFLLGSYILQGPYILENNVNTAIHKVQIMHFCQVEREERNQLPCVTHSKVD